MGSFLGRHLVARGERVGDADVQGAGQGVEDRLLASGIVSQFSLPVMATRSVAVVVTGPPCAPLGSIEAENVISRFGSVGPSTEQK
jgi:hypothetical protein